MDKLVIIGSSGHAKVIVDVVEKQGRYSIVGVIDGGRAIGEDLCGFPVLGNDDDLPRLLELFGQPAVLVAIGDNFLRWQVADRVRGLCPQATFGTAIHPNAVIGRDVSVGAGTVIMAGVSVNPSSSIGGFCILNTGSSLDHDSSMADFSSLAPRVATGGNCHLGRCSAVGIGAVLTHGVRVGDHSVVGAGSTVLRSVDSLVVAYGTPAREIRKRSPGDRYL